LKIKIKEFQGKAVTKGFFPVSGHKLSPGDVYECSSDELLHSCLNTGLVEAVIEKRKPGRPRKDEED